MLVFIYDCKKYLLFILLTNHLLVVVVLINLVAQLCKYMLNESSIYKFGQTFFTGQLSVLDYGRNEFYISMFNLKKGIRIETSVNLL